MKVRRQWSKTQGRLWLNNPRKTENISEFKISVILVFLRQKRKRERGGREQNS